MSKYFVYMLECSNNCYYTGYTTDLERRYQEHCNGSYKCKYTRSFPPKKLAAHWKIKGGLTEALKFEREIKKLSRAEKIKLIGKQSA